jgi:hypothetical protein
MEAEALQERGLASTEDWEGRRRGSGDMAGKASASSSSAGGGEGSEESLGVSSEGEGGNESFKLSAQSVRSSTDDMVKDFVFEQQHKVI